ncbi:MAG: hypothetical protein ACYCRG_06455 [Acidimicrobiales bacterium]
MPAISTADVVPASLQVEVSEMVSAVFAPAVMTVPLPCSVETLNVESAMPTTAVVGGSTEKPNLAGAVELTAMDELSAVVRVRDMSVAVKEHDTLALPVKPMPVNVAVPFTAATLRVPVGTHPALGVN